MSINENVLHIKIPFNKIIYFPWTFCFLFFFRLSTTPTMPGKITNVKYSLLFFLFRQIYTIGLSLQCIRKYFWVKIKAPVQRQMRGKKKKKKKEKIAHNKYNNNYNEYFESVPDILKKTLQEYEMIKIRWRKYKNNDDKLYLFYIFNVLCWIICNWHFIMSFDFYFAFLFLFSYRNSLFLSFVLSLALFTWNCASCSMFCSVKKTHTYSLHLVVLLSFF